ncbi:unnamed protein product [Victoria cruziana]
MQPSRPGSPPSSASQVSLPPRTESSPRSSGVMSPATAAMYDAGGHPEESMQLWETGVPPRLLSFLQREPSVFTPWNPPQPEEEDGRASAEAGRGEDVSLGNGPILPLPVDMSSGNTKSEVRKGKRLTVMVRCGWCLQAFGPAITSCGKFMPCRPCACDDYFSCCCNLIEVRP